MYEVSSFLTTVLKLAYELDWFLRLCCLPILKLSACVQLVGQWHSLAWYLSTVSPCFWFLYCTSTLRTFPSSILWKSSRYNSELLVAAYLVLILDKYHIPYWFVASCSVPLLTHNQTRKEISGTLLPKSDYDALNELIAMFGVTCLPEMATWHPWCGPSQLEIVRAKARAIIWSLVHKVCSLVANCLQLGQCQRAFANSDGYRFLHWLHERLWNASLSGRVVWDKFPLHSLCRTKRIELYSRVPLSESNFAG